MPFWIRWLAKFIGFFAWILPGSWRRALGRGLGFLAYEVFRFRRFTLLRNLSIAFPESEKHWRLRIARQSVDLLGSNLIEFLSLPWVTPDWCKKNIIFEGLHHYEASRASGRGVLMMSLHLGNGDFGCAMLSLAGLPMSLISKRFNSDFLNRFWFGVRESMGTRFIDPHSPQTAYEILGGLKKKRNIVFVLDQFMGRPFGIETLFFGRKTGTAYGLSLFAIKAKVAVLPIYTYVDDKFRVHVVFDSPIDIANDENRDLQILKTTQKYNDWIESVIRRYPEQWMWIHRRWKMWE